MEDWDEEQDQEIFSTEGGRLGRAAVYGQQIVAGTITLEDGAQLQGANASALKPDELKFLNDTLAHHLTIPIKPEDHAALWGVCKNAKKNIGKIKEALAANTALQDYLSDLAKLPVGDNVKEILEKNTQLTTTMKKLKEESPLSDDQWKAWKEYMRKRYSPNPSYTVLVRAEKAHKIVRGVMDLVKEDRKSGDNDNQRLVADPCQLYAVSKQIAVILLNDPTIEQNVKTIKNDLDMYNTFRFTVSEDVQIKHKKLKTKGGKKELKDSKKGKETKKKEKDFKPDRTAIQKEKRASGAGKTPVGSPAGAAREQEDSHEGPVRVLGSGFSSGKTKIRLPQQEPAKKKPKYTYKTVLKTIYLGNYLVDQCSKLKRDPTRYEDLSALCDRTNSTLPEWRKEILRGLLPKAKRVYKTLLIGASQRALEQSWEIATKVYECVLTNEQFDPKNMLHRNIITKLTNAKWPYLTIIPCARREAESDGSKQATSGIGSGSDVEGGEVNLGGRNGSNSNRNAPIDGPDSHGLAATASKLDGPAPPTARNEVAAPTGNPTMQGQAASPGQSGLATGSTEDEEQNGMKPTDGNTTTSTRSNSAGGTSMHPSSSSSASASNGASASASPDSSKEQQKEKDGDDFDYYDDGLPPPPTSELATSRGQDEDQEQGSRVQDEAMDLHVDELELGDGEELVPQGMGSTLRFVKASNEKNENVTCRRGQTACAAHNVKDKLKDNHNDQGGAKIISSSLLVEVGKPGFVVELDEVQGAEFESQQKLYEQEIWEAELRDRVNNVIGRGTAKPSLLAVDACPNTSSSNSSRCLAKAVPKATPMTAAFFNEKYQLANNKEILNGKSSGGFTLPEGEITAENCVPLLSLPFGFKLDKFTIEFLIRSFVGHAVEDNNADATDWDPVDRSSFKLLDYSDGFFEILRNVCRGEWIRQQLEEQGEGAREGDLPFQQKIEMVETREKIKLIGREWDVDHLVTEDREHWFSEMKPLNDFDGFCTVFKEHLLPLCDQFKDIPSPFDVSVVKLLLVQLKLFKREMIQCMGSGSYDVVLTTLSSYQEDWLRPFINVRSFLVSNEDENKDRLKKATDKSAPHLELMAKVTARRFSKEKKDQLNALAKVAKPQILDRTAPMEVLPSQQAIDDALAKNKPAPEATIVNNRPPLALMIEGAVVCAAAILALLRNMGTCTSAATFVLPTEWTTAMDCLQLLISRNDMFSQPVRLLQSEMKGIAKSAFELLATKEEKEELERKIDEKSTHPDKISVIDNNELSALIKLHPAYRQQLIAHAGGVGDGAEVLDAPSDSEEEGESSEEGTDSDSEDDPDANPPPKRTKTDY